MPNNSTNNNTPINSSGSPIDTVLQLEPIIESTQDHPRTTKQTISPRYPSSPPKTSNICLLSANDVSPGYRLHRRPCASLAHVFHEQLHCPKLQTENQRNLLFIAPVPDSVSEPSIPCSLSTPSTASRSCAPSVKRLTFPGTISPSGPYSSLASSRTPLGRPTQ